MLNGKVLRQPVQSRVDTDFAAPGTLLLAANERRIYALIVNESNKNIRIKLGSPPVDQDDGLLIAANGFSYEIDRNNLWRGEIYGIVSAGAVTKFVDVLELW